jgi:hypothetical protein
MSVNNTTVLGPLTNAELRASAVAVTITIPGAAGTPGISYGQVTTSATADIMKTAYIEQSSNAQRSIVSSSASDSSAGTGARTIKITYYDSSMAGPSTETLTLNGTTPVNTVSTTICFIEKMEILTVGSFGSAIGTISLKAATGGGGATIGTVGVGDNQTFWAHHYVPSGKICNIQKITIAAGQASGAVFNYTLRHPTVAGKAFIIGPHQRIANSSSFERSYANPIQITGPVRIVMSVTPDSNATTWYANLEYSDQ